MRNAAGAIKWMNAHREGRAGWCLWTVQEAYAAPHVTPDAAAAWRVSAHKHHDDRPPRGALVYWTGGSAGHGHVAIALGDDMILSTDLPRWGSIGHTHLSTPRLKWGLHYAGWTPTAGGRPISGIGAHHAAHTRDVYVSKLHYTQVHSQSVKWLQLRLNKVMHLSRNQHRPIKIDGHYGAYTDHEVRAWQASIGDRPDHEHRSSVGPRQAAKLFPRKRYQVHK